MLGLFGLIAIVVVTYQVYKTAKGTERNPVLWAMLAALTGIGFQVVLPFLFAVVLSIYYLMTGTPPENIESEITGLTVVFSLASLVLSIVGMVLIMKHVSKIPDEPVASVAPPPPPPTFGDNV